jgi:Ran GTPase-activating protein (RanGAP) involved in mRNA processing and transport
MKDEETRIVKKGNDLIKHFLGIQITGTVSLKKKKIQKRGTASKRVKVSKRDILRRSQRVKSEEENPVVQILETKEVEQKIFPKKETKTPIEIYEKRGKSDYFRNYRFARRNSVVNGFSAKSILRKSNAVDMEPSNDPTGIYLHAFVESLHMKKEQNLGKVGRKTGERMSRVQQSLEFHSALVDAGLSPIPLRNITRKTNDRVSGILDFSNNSIGVRRGLALSRWLASGPPNTCSVLNLSGTGVNESLNSILESILCNHLNSIESIILARNKVNKAAMLSIVRILTWKRVMGVPRSLHTIDLSETRIGDNLGFIFLRSLIPCPHIRTLRLRRCCLGLESAIMVSELLTSSLSLKTIDIRDNNIRTEGAMAIALAMRCNKSVRVLELGYNAFAYNLVSRYLDNGSSWCGSEAEVAHKELRLHGHGVKDVTIVTNILLNAISTAHHHMDMDELLYAVVGHKKGTHIPYQIFPDDYSHQECLEMMPRKLTFFGTGGSHTFPYWKALANMLISQNGNEYIKMEYIHLDRHRRGVAADSEDVISGEFRPTLGPLGKSLVASMASITTMKVNSARMYVCLAVSDEMYEANKVSRNPHHHAEQNSKQKTSTRSFSHQIFPLISLKCDPYRHALDRHKILHAVHSNGDHTPAEVLLGGLDGNATLKVLGLEKNGLTDVFCKTLLHIFKNMKKWTSLELLKLGENPGIGHQGGKALLALKLHAPKAEKLIKVDYEGTKFAQELARMEEQKRFDKKFAVIVNKEREILKHKQSLQEAKEKKRLAAREFIEQKMIPWVIESAAKHLCVKIVNQNKI